MIKHKTIIIVLFVVVNFSSKAQENKKEQNHSLFLDFGIAASQDISFSESFNDSKRLFSPTIGLQYSTRLNTIHWLKTGAFYYKIGDIYNYYTGFSANRTNTNIYVNTLKIPFLYSIQLQKGKSSNIYFNMGPSVDWVIGESKINASEQLNSPDGFRSNITQGSVEKRLFVLLNASFGLNFRNERGITNYLEFGYYGTFNGVFRESNLGYGQSNYQNIYMKIGINIFNK